MRKGVVAAILTGTLALAGCGAPSNDYSSAAAATLQQQVLGISEAAADGDTLAAITRLDELAAIVHDAVVRGLISEVRRDSILAAIALVRADFERTIEAERARLAEEEARAEAEAKSSTPLPDTRPDDDSPTTEPPVVYRYVEVDTGAGEAQPPKGPRNDDKNGGDKDAGDKDGDGRDDTDSDSDDGPRKNNPGKKDDNPGKGNKKGNKSH